MAEQVKMFNTGADYALSLIGGKWKPVILYLLAGHPRRTGELVKQLGTSHKVLSDQLRELGDAGIVARKSYNTIPPHVEYRLTEEGENLYAALRRVVQRTLFYRVVYNCFRGNVSAPAKKERACSYNNGGEYK